MYYYSEPDGFRIVWFYMCQLFGPNVNVVRILFSDVKLKCLPRIDWNILNGRGFVDRNWFHIFSTDLLLYIFDFTGLNFFYFITTTNTAIPPLSPLWLHYCAQYWCLSSVAHSARKSHKQTTTLVDSSDAKANPIGQFHYQKAKSQAGFQKCQIQSWSDEKQSRTHCHWRTKSKFLPFNRNLIRINKQKPTDDDDKKRKTRQNDHQGSATPFVWILQESNVLHGRI